MKRIASTFLLAPALLATLLALQACVIVIGKGTDDGVYWAGSSREEGGVRHDGDRLSREVAKTLAADSELIANNIRVSSKDGVIVLRGSVKGIDMLERAMTSARSVEGVSKVVSRMTVDAG